MRISEGDEWEVARAFLDLPAFAAGPEIPKIVHRFWTGGPMRQGAFALLEDAASNAPQSPSRAAEHGWTLLLWSSRILDEALGGEGSSRRDAQRAALAEKGYSLRYIEDLLTDPRLALSDAHREIVLGAAHLAARLPDAVDAFDNVRFFGDIARLLILQAMGGLYLDVDIGLGDMELDRALRHNDPAGEIPLCGALGRSCDDTPETAEDLATVREARSRGHLERGALCRLAEQAHIRAMGYNAVLASRPHTARLQLAITELLRQVAVAEDVLPPGTALQPVLLLGEQALTRGEGESLQVLDARTAALYSAARYAVPSYFARLDQLGPESRRPVKAPVLARSMLVYMSPHPDDWILFGGERVSEALNDPEQKVVLIFTTAGDAGRTDDGFWEDRERAALSAVRAAMEPCPLTTRAQAPNNHSMLRYQCGARASIWCLRLPDGAPDGTGFHETGRTSLSLLRREGRAIAAIDGSTRYESWDDLCATLSAIVEQERATVVPEGETAIHAADPSEATNPDDHQDHIATSEAALALRGEGLRYVWWKTYAASSDEPNLPAAPLGRKKRLWDAYAAELARLTALSGDPVEIGESEWTLWGARSYSREPAR